MEFRPARADELPRLCEMLENAKERLRLLGLTQWQSGIPNGEMLAADIAAGRSFVLAEQGELLASAAICFGEDESYREIDGAWPNNEPYAAIHRVFTAQDALRKGCGTLLLQKAETFCLRRGVRNLRVDTHRGNLPMQALLRRCGFSLCGVIILQNTPEIDPERLAYHKILTTKEESR